MYSDWELSGVHLSSVCVSLGNKNRVNERIGKGEGGAYFDNWRRIRKQESILGEIFNSQSG